MLANSCALEGSQDQDRTTAALLRAVMAKIGQQLRFREHSRSRAALPKVFTVQVLTRPNLQYFVVRQM